MSDDCIDDCILPTIELLEEVEVKPDGVFNIIKNKKLWDGDSNDR